MELPIVFGVEEGHIGEWTIWFDKNLYGLKYAGLSCFEKLKEGLESRGFVKYQFNPCV